MPELLDRRPSLELEALLRPGDERAARVELRRQIARLERELSELFGSAFPTAEGIEWAVSPAGGPRILGVAELERVRDELAERVGQVRGELGARAEVEEGNRLLLERMLAEPERFHWIRVSNEDIGEPGCRHYHSRPRYGVLGMLMGWWRVKVSSGCPLARGSAPSTMLGVGVGRRQDLVRPRSGHN
jgi:hypothetical protein